MANKPKLEVNEFSNQELQTVVEIWPDDRLGEREREWMQKLTDEVVKLRAIHNAWFPLNKMAAEIGKE